MLQPPKTARKNKFMPRICMRAHINPTLNLHSLVFQYSNLSWCKNMVTTSSVTRGGSVIVIIASGSCNFNPAKPHKHDSLYHLKRFAVALWSCVNLPPLWSPEVWEKFSIKQTVTFIVAVVETKVEMRSVQVLTVWALDYKFCFVQSSDVSVVWGGWFLSNHQTFFSTFEGKKTVSKQMN